MVTIRFTCADDQELLEKAHRIILLNCPVVFTPNEWEYKVPNWILEYLNKDQIPYKVVTHNHV